MLTVQSPDTSTPEVITHTSDSALAGQHLKIDLDQWADPTYAEHVFDWWHNRRDTSGMISNPDGSHDTWAWTE
jgi:hypothetical protein